MDRRSLLKSSTLATYSLACGALIPRVFVRGDEGPHPRQFRLWACGDSHVGTDLRNGRTSLADAIQQSDRRAAGGLAAAHVQHVLDNVLAALPLEATDQTEATHE